MTQQANNPETCNMSVKYHGDIVVSAMLTPKQFKSFFENDADLNWQIEEAKKNGKRKIFVEQFCGSRGKSAGITVGQFLDVGVIPKIRIPEMTEAKEWKE